ncbi:MAG: hypothetical protein ACK5WS_01035 [Alphaproteobacteria bacterium]
MFDANRQLLRILDILDAADNKESAGLTEIQSLAVDNFDNFLKLRDATEVMAEQNGVPPLKRGNLFNAAMLKAATAQATIRNQLASSLHNGILDIYKHKANKLTEEEKQQEIAREQRKKLDKIIAALNEGNYSLIYECIDLIHKNIFEPVFDKEKNQDGCYEMSHTFLSYAITKLNPKTLQFLLASLKRTLGDEIFALYIATPINPDRKNQTTTLEKWFITEYKEQRNQEKANHAERLSVLRDVLGINYNNINTHTTSANLSADISHVSAFTKMLELVPTLQVQTAYSHSNSLSSKPNCIQITTPNTALDDFTTATLKDLEVALQSVLKLSDQAIYESLLGASSLDKFDKNNETHQNKVAYCKFQTSASLRFMSEMLNHHSCGKHPGSAYPYNTNELTPCGLTIEQMLASLYSLWRYDKATFMNQTIDEKVYEAAQAQQKVEIEINKNNIISNN